METLEPMTPVPSEKWWSPELGEPSASGSQDGMRYAFFPKKQLLLIEQDGKVKSFDSGRHRIRGIAQVKNDRHSLSFTTQRGSIRSNSLKQMG